MLLTGKRLLISGVLSDASIAFAIAKRAQEEGAQIVLSSFGRATSLTTRAARRLPDPDVAIVEFDAMTEPDVDGFTAAIGGTLDGVVHAIGYAPEACLGSGLAGAEWDDVAVALRVSAYSLKSLTLACLPLMTNGGAVVALDFDNSRVAWPVYDWMGVAKAALESTARYLARDLGPAGVRVNLVAAGPLRTVAAKSIPGFERFEAAWNERAPLGWDVRDARPVAAVVCALLSDVFSATTGEIVHVDGGYHAVGA